MKGNGILSDRGGKWYGTPLSLKKPMFLGDIQK
jgi:hypothetical protein